MANKGKRMLFENEYRYLDKVIETYPDPTDIGGGSGGDVNIEAGTGIEITGDETKTISLDTTPDTFEVTASTGTTIEVENQNPLYKDAKLQMTNAGSTRLEGSTVSLEGNNIYLNSDNAPYYVNNTTHEYKTLATTDQLFSGDYDDLYNKPTIPDAVSGTNDGTNWTSLTIGNDTYGLASGGGSTYTAGTGIDITNNTISVDNTVAMKTDIPDVTHMVTDNTTQEITGEKTFTGNKILNFKQASANNRMGFTAYDTDGNEIGYSQVFKEGNSWVNLVGVYSPQTATAPTADYKLGFRYNTKDAGGTYRKYELLVPPRRTAGGAQVATFYMPMSVNGNTADNTGNISLTIPAAQIQSDWTQSDNTKKDYIKNKPTLATVATTGDYDDLINKPDLSVYAESANLATVATTGAYSDLSGTPTLATVATSGDYDDLLNKPTIPDAVSGTNDGTNWTSLTIGSDTYAIGGGSTPSNMVTTDTAQNITASKTFKGNANIYVQSGSSYTAADTLITNQMISANQINGVRVSGTEFIFQDATTTGHAQIKVKDYSQGIPATDYLITIPTKTGTMALTSDIPTVSGTNDGTNWTSLTIGSDTYAIGGGGSAPTNMVTTDTAQTITAMKTFESHGSGAYNIIRVDHYNNSDVLNSRADLTYSSLKFLNKSYSNNYHYGQLSDSALIISTDDYKDVQYLYDHIAWRKGAGSSNLESFYFGGTNAGTNQIARLKDLPTGLPTAPKTQGTYTLQVTVDQDGNPTYSWV